MLDHHPIVQRDDGAWSIGWHDDAAGPFPSRRAALAVAISQHLKVSKRIIHEDAQGS